MKKKKTEKTFYEWLKTQFTDLESAKTFFKNWKRSGQKTPYGEFTLRCMAAHISNILENKEYDPSEVISVSNTAYGIDILY